MELKPGRRGPVIQNYTPSLVKPDEYIIRASQEATIIESATERGFFYARKTLAQTTDVGLIHDYAAIPMRVAMVDLKRVEWQEIYLLGLLKQLGELKINYCLLEYEDKFPYRTVNSVATKAVLDPERIELGARKNHVEIIPLVQCFSHWEYILRYRPELREVPDVLEQACPLNPEVFELFKAMAEEVMAAHPDSKYFHVGADEARFLGHCDKCRHHAPEELYGNYLRQVVEFINSHGRTALFWGDFFRSHDTLPQLVGLDAIAVDWSYAETDVRSEKVLFPRIKTIIDFDDYDGRYTSWLDPDPKTRTFFSFPHQRVIKEAGFRCLGGGRINSPDNILAHARTSPEGVIGTYWGATNSLMPPYTVYPFREAGLKMLAAAAWNPEYEAQNRDTFYERACGEAAPHCQVLDAMDHHFAPAVVPDGLPELKNKPHFDTMMQKFQLDRAMNRLWNDELHFDCRPLPLGEFANTDRDFAVNGKQYGFTNGNFRHLPLGEKIVGGIRYNFAEKTAIFGELPENAAPYSLSLPASGFPQMISLIFASVGGRADSEGQFGTLTLLYRDGYRHEYPLKRFENIGSWWRPVPGNDAETVFANPRGFFKWDLVNPFPRRELCGIKLEAYQHSLLMLCAATLVDRRLTEAPEIELEETARKFRQTLRRYVSLKSVTEIEHLSFDSYRRKLEKISQITMSAYHGY